jgi:hypothetical protein
VCHVFFLDQGIERAVHTLEENTFPTLAWGLSLDFQRVSVHSFQIEIGPVQVIISDSPRGSFPCKASLQTIKLSLILALVLSDELFFFSGNGLYC